MIRYTQGNLLDAPVDALVNTVNTVGVMGKGIALMFKEAFPENYRSYRSACRQGEVRVGKMFVTERMSEPRFLINFPTKEHWRDPSRLEWILDGLVDLRRVVETHRIQSIAVPALGCGLGGLDWQQVRPGIERALGDLGQVEVLVYEPTQEYQSPPKTAARTGLTPARALVLELIRRYSVVLGLDASLLEIQKLAWFLERRILDLGLQNPLALQFQANRYGPYADRLRHLLEGLDGNYLHSEIRIADAKPLDVLSFNVDRRNEIEAYLKTEAATYLPALEQTASTIDGFESPMGLELLATVDWLLSREHCQPNIAELQKGLARWPGGPGSAKRKLRIFDERLLRIALNRLTTDGRKSLSSACAP